jgi:NAD+-dependent protein deacetylase sirtuin 4
MYISRASWQPVLLPGMAVRGLPSVAPPAPPATLEDLRSVVSLLSASGPVLSVSGAGLSTASGLPDYRSPGRHSSLAAAAAAERARVTHSAFVASAAVRRRYWARSFTGYPRVLRAVPNAAHRALAYLHSDAEADPLAITQNVDGLSQVAGLHGVIELHGTLHVARCLLCGHREPRGELQGRMQRVNAGIVVAVASGGAATPLRPDGDVEMEEHEAFVVPACVACGGGDASIAPDLVFYGGSVPRETVAAARAAVDACGAVVIVGSSVTTYSAYSLVKRAKEAGKTVCVLNYGPGRADRLADMLVAGALTHVLPAIAEEMGEGAWVR